MDDPHSRKKDLLDVTKLFRLYNAATERIFSDEVFAAELEEYASAFLLGLDVGAIARDEEVEILSAFIQAHGISDDELLQLDREDMRQREAVRFQQQLRAFRKGIAQNRGW